MEPLTVGLAIANDRLWDEVQAALQSLPVRIVLEQPGRVEDLITFIEKVDRFRPDVLLLDPGQVTAEMSDLIPSLKATAAEPSVIVVRETATPDDILRALRAGANEYIYSPFAGVLQDALERISALRSDRQRPGETRRSKLYGFLSVKGGCGATTLACHAAVDLAQLCGQSVLLADFDFSTGLVRLLMQVKSRYSVLDAINNTQRLDSSYWRSLVSNGYQGVEVIAGSSSDVMREHPTQHDIRQVLRFARSQYDHVIVDLGSGIDPDVVTVLEDLDHLILVATPDLSSLKMAKLSSVHLNRIGFRADKIKLVLNRMSRRVELSTQEIESAIGMPVFATIPNDYSALERVYSEGQLLPEHHHLRGGIRQLMKRVAEVGVAETKKKFSIFGF